MKTLKFFKISLTLVFILFSSFCCVDDDDFPDVYEKPVILVNQTDEVILVHYCNSEDLSMQWLFWFDDNTKFISPGVADIINYYFFSESMNYRQVPLTLYIIKKSTLDKFTINEIYEQNIYDDKLIFSFDELLELNFKINYK